MSDYILGGGMTGLAAGMASGFAVLEAEGSPGGICSSYYLRPGEKERLHTAPADGDAYRFEIGGGHWIFGGDSAVLGLLRNLCEMREYRRVSSIHLAERGYVPYPIQNNLRSLGPELAARALAEMARPGVPPRTLREWLAASFGPTLCELFFFPFHELYTSGLYSEVAPQDAYKSPSALEDAIRGAFSQTAAVGYNTTYLYPADGLDALARSLAARSRIEYAARVVGIDTQRRELRFADGRQRPYRRLVSTLPLHHTLELAGLTTAARADPFSSVLVLNIGAVRGPACPPDHWVYVARSRAGFHRVGVYSNVDSAFVPRGRAAQCVGLYVERSFRGRPSHDEVQRYCADVVDELAAWGYIAGVEVLDPTWIEVAYTWSWPNSSWRREALQLVEQNGISPVGRYGRWVFQGIADSIRDGLFVGASLRAAL